MFKIRFKNISTSGINDIIRNNQIFILICTVYVILSLSLIFYNPHTFSYDTLSYINIAQNYFNGNFTDAINRYWGPLYSWILIPFMYTFGNSPSQSLFAIKIVNIIAGLFTLMGFQLLLIRFEINSKLRYILLITLIPEIVYFSFFWITPDLLITSILLFYLVLLFSSEYSNKASFAVLCGLLGGLAYFAKSYGFAFFIISFTLFNFIYLLKMKSKRKNILKNTILGFGIFFIVSGLWIGVMSANYGYLTMGSSAQFNIGLTSSNSLGTSMEINGLSDLPNEFAVSFWEDPSSFQPKVVQRQPLDSIEHRLSIIWNNVFIFYGYIESFSILSAIIILSSIIYLISHH